MKNINYITVIFITTLLQLLCSFHYGQSNRNALLGRYIVSSKRLNGSLVTTQTCDTLGKLDLNISTYCNECILENDSTDCNGSLGMSWQSQTCYPIKVFADSTLLDTAGFDPAYFATGKLYANDSVYFRFKFCTLSEHLELNGFKLYSTITKLNELNLPENALLLSPNPAKDLIYLQSTQYTFTERKPVMYDMNGQKINCEMIYVNSHTYKADVSNLSPGIFFIFIQTNKGYLKKKVLVSR